MKEKNKNILVKCFFLSLIFILFIFSLNFTSSYGYTYNIINSSTIAENTGATYSLEIYNLHSSNSLFNNYIGFRKFTSGGDDNILFVDVNASADLFAGLSNKLDEWSSISAFTMSLDGIHTAYYVEDNNRVHIRKINQFVWYEDILEISELGLNDIIDLHYTMNKNRLLVRGYDDVLDEETIYAFRIDDFDEGINIIDYSDWFGGFTSTNKHIFINDRDANSIKYYNASIPHLYLGAISGVNYAVPSNQMTGSFDDRYFAYTFWNGTRSNLYILDTENGFAQVKHIVDTNRIEKVAFSIRNQWFGYASDKQVRLLEYDTFESINNFSLCTDTATLRDFTMDFKEQYLYGACQSDSDTFDNAGVTITWNYQESEEIIFEDVILLGCDSTSNIYLGDYFNLTNYEISFVNFNFPEVSESTDVWDGQGTAYTSYFNIYNQLHQQYYIRISSLWDSISTPLRLGVCTQITPYPICTYETIQLHIICEETPTLPPTTPHDSAFGDSPLEGTLELISGLFPESTAIGTRAKYLYVLITIGGVTLILFLTGATATSGINPLMLWIIVFIDFLLFMMFVSIGYINIGTLIVLVLLGIFVAYFKFFNTGGE